MKEKMQNVLWGILAIAMLIGMVWLIWIDSKPDPTEGVSVLPFLRSRMNELQVSRNREVKIKSHYDFFFATSPTTHITVPSDKTGVLKDILFENATISLPEGIDLRYITIDLFPKDISWSMWTGDSTNTVTASGYEINIQAILYVNSNAESSGEIALELPNLQRLEQEINATVTFPNDGLRSGNSLSLQKVKVHDSFFGVIYGNVSKWFGVFVFVVFIFGMYPLGKTGLRIKKGINIKKILDNGRKTAEANNWRFESGVIQIEKRQMNVNEAYSLANRYIWRTITGWIVWYVVIYMFCTPLEFYLSFIGLIIPILGYFGKLFWIESE